jgi:membrane peptidoglycan carboxypeptidase
MSHKSSQGIHKKHHKKKPKKSLTRRFFRLLSTILKRSIILSIVVAFLGAGGILMWIATLNLPDLDSFNERKISSSTKIYDREGEEVLFDIHENFERILVDYDEISQDIKNAFIAIEDNQFYTHPGIDIRATFRAIIFTALKKLGIRDDLRVQGGSTITQQVIKNTLLTSKRSISRKVREWVLALKLEKVLTKDEILEQYLNEVPFGGNMYGIEQGSRSFFNTRASDVTIAQAAYLAAIPNAPTYYSPYGNNKDKLDARKDKVISNLFKLGYITEEEYNEAITEEVIFRPKEDLYAKSLHFVEYIRAYIEKKYGKDVIENDGLKVITTLDYDLQSTAEAIVFDNAHENEELWDASNQGVVVIEPSTGHILTMVGSRDYADDSVDGKFNVTLAKRQPGSSFKPFIYATAFDQGYTDESILFDLRTQFHEDCDSSNLVSDGVCYSPGNYDGLFEGPLTLRQALARSRNVPAVKLLYLVGVRNAINLATNMGITTLGGANQYGLTLVLGGGEVSLLDMTSAYGVFANDGIRNPYTGIIRIEDAKGNILEEYKPQPERVISKQVSRTVSSILSDNAARTPLFGSRSFLYFGDRIDAAGKTGTTNNNKDAWLVGYTTGAAVGVWSGNNDNTPMKKGSSISGSTWRAVMNEALKKYPASSFKKHDKITTGKPFLDGFWLGGTSFTIDTISEKLATEHTPPETRKETPIPNIHSTLHWVKRGNPLGPIPTELNYDSLYENWEYSIDTWATEKGYYIFNEFAIDPPEEFDDIHIPENFPEISITSLNNQSEHSEDEDLEIEVEIEGEYDPETVEFFLNGTYIGESTGGDFSYTIDFNDLDISLRRNNTLRAVVIDKVYNRAEVEIEIELF